jgi:voltage-gated potassium channel
MKDLPEHEIEEALERERYEFLHQVESILEVPVLLLGFAWLGLLVIDLIWGLSPLLEIFFYIIWGVFIIDFGIRFILAPRKIQFIKHNWLTAISLMIPALRVFQVFRIIRVLRVARAARSLNLVRVVSSINRSMRSLRNTMARRGFGYVVGLSIIVAFAGAAGMFTFERGAPGFENYSDALWWTLMIMVTMGSGEWPQTAEGRILSFLLSLYAFAVFGYVTATLASFFIGREVEAEEGDIAGAKKLESLREEIQDLRAELARFNQENQRGGQE